MRKRGRFSVPFIETKKKVALYRDYTGGEKD